MKEYFMNIALNEAMKAYNIEEVPVGAVIVKDEKIIGKGFNQKESLGDPTMHAEIIAVRQACEYLKSWRLTGCTIYSTLEPCPMCTGALVNARIDKIIIGTKDMKTGACGSVMNIADNENLNHKISVEFGILEKESEKLLQKFFMELRRK